VTAGRPPSAEALAARLDARDPAVGLPALAALRRLLDDLEAAHVARARSAGWSWADIADALGVSRQSVHKKHARTLPRR
jgi:hypothetical protein